MDGQELRKRHNDRAPGYLLTHFLYYQTGRLQKQSVGWFLVSKHFSAGTLLHVPSGLKPSLKQLADSIWSVRRFSYVIFLCQISFTYLADSSDIRCVTLAEIVVVPRSPVLPNILGATPNKSEESTPRRGYLCIK